MKNNFTWQNWILAFSITVIVGILGFGVILFIKLCHSARKVALGGELLAYSLHGETAKIEPLLAQGAPINFSDCGTPLEAALENGHPDIARILIERGANVNTQFAMGDGGTALMFVVSNKDTALIKLLLEHGADVRIRDRAGKSALDIAKANHDIARITLLKEAKAK